MKTPLTLAEVNALSVEDFVSRFGDVAEDSPWVARRADGGRPFGNRQAMVEAFMISIQVASAREQLDLVVAHPDLGGKVGLAGDSQKEQAGAGLDSLSEAEFARFNRLNKAYRERFGFPFILAVKGANRHQIFAAFEARIRNDVEEEFATALSEIARIVRFRIEERVLESPT